MRLRNTVIATASALMMTLSMTSSAQAADGEFEYRGSLGRVRLLVDPPSGECINLEHATDLVPASSPWNRTNATATVFLDFDCDGDTYYVMTPGKKLGLLLKLRSVSFS
ncbi:hypothetical protein [Streptomyces sp. NPDC008265]|uniref:hypothetical protein n=1 Tax=Streptomyces sp. NPDC008265 TaxID=3364824 RepID=UPI0036E2896F